MTNNTIMRTLRRPSWVNRIIAYTTLAIMVIQNISFATAATLASTTIQYDLSNNPLFERALTGNYQYVTNTYVEQSAPASAITLAGFYTRLENDYKPNLGKPAYIPIGIDPVIIIPVYEKPRFVGSPLVQSRYVRYQVQTLLGRNLIDADTSAYATETKQINTLYDNALWYLSHENPDAVYGQNLNLDQENSGLAKDIIWPEFRIINGEKVVVPIVYLTSATVAARKVTEHETAFNSQASFNNLVIDDVAVRFGRQAFLSVAGNLLNNQGQLSGSGDLQIVVDGAINNLSGIIQSTGDLRISAHSIHNQTIVHRYDFGGKQGGRFGEIAAINSTNGDVTLRSHSDILIEGGIVNAPAGGINFAADGNIYIGPVQYTESGSSEGRGWNSSYSRTNILQSSLSAEQTIQMIAQGEIKIDAAEIVSDQGHIELLAGLGITIEDELSRSQSVSHYKFGKTTTDVSAYKTVAMRSILDAGKGVRIHSEYGDIAMRAADITSSEGANVKASNGAVNLLMTVENDHYSYSSIKKSLFTIKTVNRGHDIETGVPNSIVGGLHVEALNGVNVEYEGDPELTLDEQVQVLSQFEGLEWMADVRANVPNADWTAIDLAYEEWDKTSTTLSPAALAIIVIVVAVVTAGTGVAAAAGAAAGGGTMGAAVSAGVASLISQVAVAVANGAVNGDIGGALEDLASSDTVKSLAIAMVTAGAIAAIDAQFFDAAQLGENSSLTTTETITRNVGGVERIIEVPALSFTGQAIQSVTHATVQAGVQTAVNGGSLSDSLVYSLSQNSINLLGEYTAGAIGDAFDGPNATGLDTAFKYISHAGAGCLLGSATAAIDNTDAESGCYAGAGGAVIGEFVASQYRSRDDFVAAQEDLENFLFENQDFVDSISQQNLSREEALAVVNSENNYRYLSQRLSDMKRRGVDLAKLSAALGAFVAGADEHAINIAAQTAENAAQHNTFDSVERLVLAASQAMEVIRELEEAWQKSKGPLQIIAERISEEFGAWVIDKGVGLQETIEADAANGDLFASLVLELQTSPASPAFGRKPHIIAGVLAGVVDLGIPSGLLLDMAVRNYLAEGSGANTIFVNAANALDIDVAELNLDTDPYIQANIESAQNAVNDFTQLLSSHEQVFEMIDSMTALAAEGDLRAQAEIARLTVQVVPVVFAVGSAGAAAGAAAVSISRAASRLLALLRSSGHTLDDINDVLPSNMRIRESDGVDPDVEYELDVRRDIPDISFNPRSGSNGINQTSFGGKTYEINIGHAWNSVHNSGVAPSSTGVSQSRLQSVIVRDLDNIVRSDSSVIPSPSAGMIHYDRIIVVDEISFGYRTVKLNDDTFRVITFWVH